MENSTEHMKRSPHRGFKILLGVSLALNLAVVGVMVGAMLRKGPDGHQRGDRHVSFARPYIQALPREDRVAVFEATRSTRKRTDRGVRLAHYQEMTDILRAENFDRAAIENVLTKQGAMTLNAQNAGQNQWLDLIEKMDAKERGSYADAIEDVLKRGPERKRIRAKD
jgi:hypothetical protein